MSEEEKLQLENECLLKYSKAQMIQKYIDELEENCNLSDLWCKSQEENKELKQKVKYYENFEINKTVDKIRLENNKKEKELQNKLQQKENIIKEAREIAERELKIAEENIKNSEQWLEVEEEQEHAKKDIHTGKIVKRYMEMFLEILDKVEE